ncbi:hypothetical protein OROMI_007221 [Orobanche minor]
MGLVFMCILWQLMKKVFLGSLREAEVERLNEQLWREVMEIQASVSLFFAFEYMILATTTISKFLKYTFYVGDMIIDGQWEKKAVYTFYLELARDLLHLTMYMCFFLVIFVWSVISYLLILFSRNYGVPLHLIRMLYETFRNFKIRVADYLRYRKITSNMNDRFPDATSEELNSSDATCIICREEMTIAKKLLCGHLFHVHCLRSWLERQNTCPTCRAPVVPPENGTTTTGTRADGHQHGTSATGTFSQGSASAAVANGNISHHQARLQAAASAAAMYQKSFVYPSPSTLVWSPGQTSLPQTFGPMMANDGGEGAASGLPQQYQFPNMTFMQSPQGTFMPSGFEGHNGQYGSASGSQPELHVKLIERQIEFLQGQLQLLQERKNYADVKGKAVSSSPHSSVINSSETSNTETTD